MNLKKTAAVILAVTALLIVVKYFSVDRGWLSPAFYFDGRALAMMLLIPLLVSSIHYGPKDIARHYQTALNREISDEKRVKEAGDYIGFMISVTGVSAVYVLVFSLMVMFQDLRTEKIGPNLAMAMIGFLYGVFLILFWYLPLRQSLKKRQ